MAGTRHCRAEDYLPRTIPTNRSNFTEEAIEVEDRKRQWLGGSWRYIAGGLYRGSHRSRRPERTVAGRQLAVYSRRALQRKGGRGGGGEGRRKKGGREKSRNLTTPHRRGGEQYFKNNYQNADVALNTNYRQRDPN